MDALSASFERWADRVAISEGDELTTYRELDDITDRAAGAFIRMGLRPLDRGTDPVGVDGAHDDGIDLLDDEVVDFRLLLREIEIARGHGQLVVLLRRRVAQPDLELPVELVLLREQRDPDAFGGWLIARVPRAGAGRGLLELPHPGPPL